MVIMLEHVFFSTLRIHVSVFSISPTFWRLSQTIWEAEKPTLLVLRPKNRIRRQWGFQTSHIYFHWKPTKHTYLEYRIPTWVETFLSSTLCPEFHSGRDISIAFHDHWNHAPVPVAKKCDDCVVSISLFADKRGLPFSSVYNWYFTQFWSNGSQRCILQPSDSRLKPLGCHCCGRATAVDQSHSARALVEPPVNKKTLTTDTRHAGTSTTYRKITTKYWNIPKMQTLKT